MMKRHLVGIVIGLLTLIVGEAFYSKAALPWGGVKARLDLLRGKRFIMICYDPNGQLDEYNKALKPYGVVLVYTDGCRVSQAVRDELRGYNFVSTNAITEKYGKDFFEKTLSGQTSK